MLRKRIEEAIGDETIEAIHYLENRGTLRDPDERWHEYSSLSEVPNQALDGWEELIVYTSRHVHRWVPAGYGDHVTTVPRHPEAASKDTDYGGRGARIGRP